MVFPERFSLRLEIGSQGNDLLLLRRELVPDSLSTAGLVLVFGSDHKGGILKVVSLITRVLEALNVLAEVVIYACKVSSEKVGENIGRGLFMGGEQGNLLIDIVIECHNVILGHLGHVVVQLGKVLAYMRGNGTGVKVGLCKEQLEIAESKLVLTVVGRDDVRG